ncbi:MAG: preprotein translocase subunit SecA, partial [bacterium]
MVTSLIAKVFGTKSERDLKKAAPVVEEINSRFADLLGISDYDLRHQTDALRLRLAEGAAPDDLVSQAFAAIKETSRRLVGKRWPVCDIDTEWNMVPFDVQLLGAMVLNQGRISEMATGEGKTLVATMPLYLNALSGKGSHLVTVNDYLGKRDSQWMGKIYQLLGMTVGCIQHDMEPPERIAAYRSDITYGTNNEFGFDYLRDNMATQLDHRVQRKHHYAIVDEVDSILIDEARTPLIISGPVSVSTQKFDVLKSAVEHLAKEQTRLVNNMLAEAEKESESGDQYKAGIDLLVAKRGAPKNKRFFKFMQDGNMRRIVDKVERDFMRDKRLREIDEELFFSIDERQNTVDLSEKGRKLLERFSPLARAGARDAGKLAPEVRVTAEDGGIQFSDKTKKVLGEDQTLEYLAGQAYPEILVSEAGPDSLFLLPDSALASQRIDSESGQMLKGVLVEVAKPEGTAVPDRTALERFFEEWLELNPAFVTAVQMRLRKRFEEDYAERSELLHNIAQLLKAYSLFDKDVEYVVKDGKVVIVDEFTGRLMPGRRYSDGLHQALEVKEGVTVERETQTFATITIQNYFRLYEKLAGMTGTAETEAAEFYQIYKLEVTVVPTNEPVRRVDYQDVIYLTRREKYNAIVDEIARMHEIGRPVLVGTVSVEVSEVLSRLLKRRGIPHSVLNAKYHEQEARIVARAGERGAVTIATNMAGRGTDIKLAPEVVRCAVCCYKCTDGDCGKCEKVEKTAAKCVADMPCGLHIIGTERHESRRIDRQLRGRSGRQGDPGSSRFYMSLEDDLMRLFGSDRLAGVISKLGLKDGDAIEHSLITRQIERAQRRVEANNFATRKHLLEYDDVMNKQREVVYGKRLLALESEDISGEIKNMIEAVVDRKIDKYVPKGSHPEDWDTEGLKRDLEAALVWRFNLGGKGEGLPRAETLEEEVRSTALAAYEAKQKEVGYELIKTIERGAMLYVIDSKWRDHLYDLDSVKAGIGLRAYGQKDPLIEYKAEAYDLFVKMVDSVEDETVSLIFHGRWSAPPEDAARRRRPMREVKPDIMVARGPESASGLEPVGAPRRAAAASGGGAAGVGGVARVGRNDPCPCGSG